jgi:hypothetical protein
MRRTATCACGNLSMSCEGEPTKVSLCHCLDCQRRTGSTYGIAAFFRRSDVNTKGEDRIFTRTSDSGSSVEHHFCPRCGCTVFWYPQRMPDLVAVGVGSFADPAFPAPSQAVFSRSRHHWVAPIDGRNV